jgi:16S rRNA (uracil1498-N3)-methyltransferase
MKQFLLTNPPNEDGLVQLRGRDYHYLVRVLRLKPGDTFPVSLPGGLSAEASLVSSDGGIARVRLSGEKALHIARDPSERKRLYLFQALPRSVKMDLIVRQASEWGVDEIVPFRSERSIENEAENEARFERWQRIIKEARQQSGSGVETLLHPLCSRPGAIDYWKEICRTDALPGLGLFFSPERPLAKTSIHGYLKEMGNTVLHPGCSIALVIGPESGWSDEDEAAFIDVGFNKVWMGNNVLRTETASVSAISALKLMLLEDEAWMK